MNDQQQILLPPTSVTADGHDIGRTWGHDAEYILEQTAMSALDRYRLRRQHDWAEPDYDVDPGQWGPRFWRDVALRIRHARAGVCAWVDTAMKAEHESPPPPAILTSQWLSARYEEHAADHRTLVQAEKEEFRCAAQICQRCLSFGGPDALAYFMKSFIDLEGGNRLFAYLTAWEGGLEEIAARYEFDARYRLAMAFGVDEWLAGQGFRAFEHLAAATDGFEPERASEPWQRLTGGRQVHDEGVSQ